MNQRLTSVFGRSITFLMATVLFLDFQCPFHTCPDPPLPTGSMNSRSANSNGQYYKFQFFFKGTVIFCSDIHYETHLELKYLNVSVQTLIWVCYGSKMQ